MFYTSNIYQLEKLSIGYRARYLQLIRLDMHLSVF